MTIMGSVDIAFTNSTKIAKGAEQTATTAQETANGAAQTAGQAQETAEAATQTATQAAEAAADAAQAAQTAIATANGKNKAYYGATTPTSPKSGDIWFVEDSSGNVTAIKHYDGTQWITDVDNTALEQQISAAQAAADNAATVGQAAQQTAADAEAKGDAAAKAAGEAKDAATKAQADAASAVTSANNAVSTANQATQVAQDAIDKAQDGFDAAQDALSKAGAAETNSQSALNTANTAAKDAQSALTAASNATDTANTAKQVASDAATAASTAKTNAQTAMSNAQDAISQAKAANDNANTREKSIIKSNTAPSNPATDQLWIDTSKTPQIMRRWNGSAWVDLSPTQASQIGAVSTTTYTTDITNINNTLSQKASATTVNTLTGRVDKAETAISQNASDIALKADKTYVDTLKNTVDSHSTLISQNADAIALKASQSTVDALTGRVSTAEATLKTQADQIAARITKTDADAKYATQASLTATANSLTSNISAVQTNLDNLQIGTRNYITNSNFKNGSTGFREWSPGERKGSRKIVDINDLPGFTNGYQMTLAENKNSAFGFAQDAILVNNETYTLSCYVKTTEDVIIQLEIGPDGTGFHDQFTNVKANTWTRLSYTYAVNDTADHKINVYFGFALNEASSTASAIFTGLKLEKGNRATDWSPAPEDMATVIQFNTLSQTLDSTVSRIGNAEGNISALQQTASSFATRISNAEGNISTLTQTAQGLQTAVSGKVDTTTYNSFVTQTNTALQSKLSATDADAKYATQASLTQTANSLTSSITAVQTNLDNLQVGGRNLIINSNFSNGLTNFREWNPGTYTSTVREVVSDTTLPGFKNVVHLSADVASQGWGFAQDAISVLPNTTYTYSFWYKFISTYGKVAIQISNGSAGFPTNFYTYADNLWHRATITITTGNNVNAVNIYAGVYGESKSGEVYITGEKLEVGNKPTDWTPAPEDMATQSQISQLSDDINLRVQKNDVINQINISTEGILIDGKKVHITGQTTIDNAVIKDAMIQSVTANKLTAGTIDANVITVKNINASNIVTGTLDASKATVANIDASKITTGTLNAARIAAGSIDASKLNVSSLSALSANLGNVTAGNISGVNINIGNGNFSVDTAGNLVAKNANITGIISGSTINGSDFYSSGENGEIHIYDEFIESFEQISDIETSLAIISSGNFSQTYRVSSSIYKASSLSPGSLMIYDINSGRTDIIGGEIITQTITANSLSATTIIGSPKFGGDVDFQNHNLKNVNQLIFNDQGTHEGLIWNGGNGWEIYESPNDLSNDKGNMQFVCGGNRLLTIGTDGVLNSLPTYNRTYSYSANMYVTSNGYFGRVTSALKYKTDVEEVDLSNGYAERILQLKPKSWHDKAQLERYNSGEDIHLDRNYGLIAEDVEAAGLSEYVTYIYKEDGSKETEGLEYDRLWTLLIPIVKNQKEKIQYLEGMSQQLVLKIANLENRLAKLEA